MLSSLSIQDFVIVDKLDLNFDDGMSVLSGETGAGKSILIDALSLCLGARSDVGQVREGCERANITAVFTCNAEAAKILQEQAIDVDDELYLRRSIDAKGKSKAFVNGVAVPAATLKELASTLIDIHGQHAFQTLAKPSEQLRILDNFGQHHDLLAATSNAYTAFKKAQTEFEQAQTGQNEREARIENLQWRLSSVKDIAPKEGQWEELTQRHEKLNHGAELIEGTQKALDELSQNDQSIIGQIGHLIDTISKLAQTDKDLEGVANNLSEGEILLREASYELSHYLKNTDLDPELLEQAEIEMSAWHEAARKLKVMPEQLPAEFQSIQEELAKLTGDLNLDALHEAVLQAKSKYDSAAKQLGAARAQSARELSRRVTDSMQNLSMAGGLFEIRLQACDASRTGSEAAEFLVAGHPGVSPQPITKVASGGELARISLAITVNTVEGTEVPTLIFDEVDSGIGGAVAETVGKYLRKLASSKQVLCVTHLPQVASQGHHHYQVNKEIREGLTRSNILQLDSESRVMEIARMLGGISITEATKQAARDLIGTAE